MLFRTLAAAAFAASSAAATPLLATRDLWHSDAWLGCVKSSAYTAEKFSDAAMTPDLCEATCTNSNYMYAVVTGGITCACTNDIADEDVVSELLCTTPCVGDALLSCGGSALLHYWDVYLTPTVTIG